MIALKEQKGRRMTGRKQGNEKQRRHSDKESLNFTGTDSVSNGECGWGNQKSETEKAREQGGRINAECSREKNRQSLASDGVRALRNPRNWRKGSNAMKKNPNNLRSCFKVMVQRLDFVLKLVEFFEEEKVLKKKSYNSFSKVKGENAQTQVAFCEEGGAACR